MSTKIRRAPISGQFALVSHPAHSPAHELGRVSRTEHLIGMIELEIALGEVEIRAPVQLSQAYRAEVNGPAVRLIGIMRPVKPASQIGAMGQPVHILD